ncbi:MAG: TonB-dependent receptor [Hyphomonadaceae bacterium]|nr:TonB-dependent receptor [Hyphomonadaceae bacterium]
MNRIEFAARLGLLVSAATAALAAPAYAQQGQAPPKADTSRDIVIVTARKVDEDVQDVPVTVNVLSADDLENRAAETISDIGSLVPNVLWDDSGGGTLANRITMRGIASNASKNGFDPGVGIYVDDVYIANEIGFNGGLLDVDRIEVLKGPQGTLFGRNTTAGAISIVTRRPSADDAYLEFDVTAGNYNLRQFRVVGNVPISPNAALKVSAISRERDGYLYNIVTGKRDINDENHKGMRAQLLWQPSDAVEILASAHYFHDEGSAEAQTCWGPGTANCQVRHPTRESVIDGIGEDNASISERNMWGASLRANYDAPSGMLYTSISAYEHLDAFNDQDQDYTALDVIRSGFTVPDDWQFSQEFRLTTPQDQKLRGVAGLYYFHEEREAITPLTYGPIAIANFGGPAGQSGTALTEGQIGTDSYAIYGQGQYDLTPTLTGEIGLRYTNDSKDFTYVQTLSSALLAIPPARRNQLGIPLVVPESSASDSWGQLTGTASLSWRPTEDVMLYGRYSRGYKSGGFQNAQSNPDAQGVFLATVPFGPEIMDQYEVGFRSEFLDNRFRFNFSAFRMEYSDIQQQTTNANFAKFVTNAGDVLSEGIEAEFVLLPFEGMSLFGNFGLVHSEFVKIKPGGDQTLVGRELSYSPQTTGSIGFTYERPLFGDWGGMVSFVHTYRSDIALNNNGSVMSPALPLTNGRIGIENDNGWGVYAFGSNLFDSRRITAFSGPKAGLAQGSARPSAPMTYGVELRGAF